jgi:hypothetical protein
MAGWLSNQREFNRVANAAFAATIGIFAGSMCLLISGNGWTAMIAAVLWTASTSYSMSRS